MGEDNQQQLVGAAPHLAGLSRGDTVKVRSPGPGERGHWIVEGEVRNSGPADPAYDVHHQINGRPRIFRRSRLQRVAAAAPQARQGPTLPADPATPPLFEPAEPTRSRPQRP
jgi:hypothetical protein